jgi:hydroxyacylglutathione hydrolase
VTVSIHEFVDEGLGHSSYLLDLGDGGAALVDPPRFPLAHEARAAQLGLRIAWTVDTHSHADYVTGSPGVAARVGATFVAPAASRLEAAHRAVRDGEHVELSPGVHLVALATPGHTPDHHAFVLEADGRPIGLFSGGSLMVGTVGRTDLCGPDLAEPLAREMYRSLRRFDALPAEIGLYPTHGAGSFCSAPGASERTSTLGRERATNPLLLVDGEDEFVARLLAGFGTFPRYFGTLPEVNRRGPARIDVLPALGRLDADTVARHVAAGALVVDARPFSAFAAAHIPGSLSNALRPVFGSWLGWLVDAGRPLVFVLDDGQDRADLVRQCLDVGHEHLVGELGGGIDAWAATGRDLASIPVVRIDQVSGTVVDVRQVAEYQAGHVPGARNIELGAVAAAEVPAGALTLMCGHGERAATAASILAVRGVGVSIADGGPETWATATGQPLQVTG